MAKLFTEEELIDELVKIVAFGRQEGRTAGEVGDKLADLVLSQQKAVIQAEHKRRSANKKKERERLRRKEYEGNFVIHHPVQTHEQIMADSGNEAERLNN